MIAMYEQQLCPSPWRTPSNADFAQIGCNTSSTYCGSTSEYWGVHGWLEFKYYAGNQWSTLDASYYWSNVETTDNPQHEARCILVNSLLMQTTQTNKAYGLALRCIR
jgi:hypothetical protein